MITIQINGQERRLPKPLTLQDLLKEAEISTQAIAVAVNAEIVPRSEFQKIRLRDRDQVEVIRAVGGG